MLLLLAATARASALRVTTWSFPANDAAAHGTGAETIARAAESLGRLHAEVIILENVRDRESCQALVNALKPENYEIAACSAFHYAPGGQKGKGQVAILSQTKALLGWSEGWQNGGDTPALPGGFAFAEIRKDGRNLALLAAHLGLEEVAAKADHAAIQRSRSLAAEQLFKTIDSFRGWNSNPIDTVILAGDLQSAGDARADAAATFPGLGKRGFVMALDRLPEHTPARVGYVFTKGAGSVASLVSSRTDDSLVQPLTFDLSLDLHPAPLRLPTANPNSGDKKGPVVAAANPVRPIGRTTSAFAKTVMPHPAGGRFYYWRIGGLVLTGLLVLWVALRFFVLRNLRAISSVSKGVQRREANPGVGLAEHLSAVERAGLVSSLTLWLKQKLVQRLVSDRRQLLATQHAASLAMLAMDERLTQLEHAIQRRNQEYEQRIEELQKDLALAREENRELIRFKIELLKLEIAKNAAKPDGLPSRN